MAKHPSLVCVCVCPSLVCVCMCACVRTYSCICVRARLCAGNVVACSTRAYSFSVTYVVLGRGAIILQIRQEDAREVRAAVSIRRTSSSTRACRVVATAALLHRHHRPPTAQQVTQPPFWWVHTHTRAAHMMHLHASTAGAHDTCMAQPCPIRAAVNIHTRWYATRTGTDSCGQALAQRCQMACKTQNTQITVLYMPHSRLCCRVSLPPCSLSASGKCTSASCNCQYSGHQKSSHQISSGM